MLKVTQVKFVVGLGGTKTVEPGTVLSAATIGKRKKKKPWLCGRWGRHPGLTWAARSEA